MKWSDMPKHHAILITHPERDSFAVSLWEEISGLSPAHKFFNQTVLDIDTARKIISWARDSYNEERIALVSFHTAGIPAQNAMLKILEEPRPGTRFVLLTSNAAHLLPTVMSRVHHIRGLEKENGINNAQAQEFLQTPHSSRMKLPFISDMLARTDEEGRKDRESVRGFILSVSAALSEVRAEPRFIQETIQVASYASDPSASGKALLEYLSLLLPEIK